MGLLSKLKKVAKKAIKVGTQVATGNYAGALGTVAGAVVGSKGAKKAAGASSAGYNDAAAEQRNALMTVQQNNQPYMDLGGAGVNALMRVNSGDYSGFETSPDYLYARSSALDAVEGSRAASGGLFSGNTGRRLAEVGSDLASRNLGAYRDSLFRTIGVGQSAVGDTNNATLGVAGNVGNALIGAGDSRASGITGSTNAITGGIEDLTGLAGNALAKKVVKKPKAVRTGVY